MNFGTLYIKNLNDKINLNGKCKHKSHSNIIRIKYALLNI